jgi:hypothetical protein
MFEKDYDKNGGDFWWFTEPDSKDITKEVKFMLKAKKPFLRGAQKFFRRYEFIAIKFADKKKCLEYAKMRSGLSHLNDAEFYNFFRGGYKKYFSIKWSTYIITIDGDEFFYLGTNIEHLTPTWLAEKDKFKAVFYNGGNKKNFYFEWLPVYDFRNWNYNSFATDIDCYVECGEVKGFYEFQSSAVIFMPADKYLQKHGLGKGK